MGQNSSQQSRPAPSIEVAFEASKALCKIIVERDGVKASAGGFLGKFTARGGADVHGLFTNYHVLSNAQLVDGKQITVCFDGITLGIKQKPLAVSLCTTGLFRFTCPLLGAAFIRFDQATMGKFSKCHFFKIDHQKVLSKGDKLTVYQKFTVAKGRDTIVEVEGAFVEHHGMGFFHSASTNLSGSPVALSNGSVIGIHKKSVSSGNLAVTMTAVIKALLPYFVSHAANVPAVLICNPVALKQQYNQKILEVGLTAFLGPRAAGLNCIYMHKECPFKSTMLGIPLTAPMWFVPTSHGWFWTPTDPSKSTQATNWMAVSDVEIIGGMMQDWTPVDTSVTIIQWLSQHNIVCGVCPKL